MINDSKDQYRNKIFPVTYYKDTIENNDEIKKSLIPILNERYKDLKPPNNWITNKLHTSFDRINDDCDELFFGGHNFYPTILEKSYKKCFENFFNDEYIISIKNIWYNYYLEDEYQEWHDHLGSTFNPAHFACVHFLSYDDEIHQPTIFKDPLNKLRDHSCELEYDFHGQQHIPNIKEGDFLMFPSYLDHCVYPVKKSQKCPRITISFNVFLLKYGEESFV
jgi:hypothetical protein